jgi:type 1 glutamine amidotransferase
MVRRALGLLAACVLGTVLGAPRGGAAPRSGEQPAKLRMLVLGGGLNTRHLFAHNGGLLCDRLRYAELATCTLTDDLDGLRGESLRNYDVLMIYGWRATDRGGSIRSEARKRGLLEFLRRGGGLVVVHIGNGCFDDWPEFGRIVGRVWVTGTSTHTEYKDFKVRLTERDHPVLAGLEDFETTDELYQRLVARADVRVLATASEAGVDEPMAWTRDYGKARVFYTALGDSPESWNNETFLQILAGAVQWSAGRPVRRMPRAPGRNSLHGR